MSLNDELSERAGVFVAVGRGEAGYRAFRPRPLPPEPGLSLGGGLLGLFGRATAAVGRLDGVSARLRHPDAFLWTYVRKEAVLSSQIEGTQSSLTDLLLHESSQAPGVPTDDVQEVSSYVRAMMTGLDLLRTRLPLSLRLIREIHAELVRGTRGADKTPGEFRRSQNWIGGSRPGNARYVPPPPEEMLPALDNLEKFLHDPDVPPLIKAGLAHAQFETIHPFLDGNGRVGRLLITMILIHEQVLSAPMLYMSLHFKRHHQEYYERLQRIRTHGDWEGWMDYFLDGVATVAVGATATIDRLDALLVEHRALLAGRSGSIYQAAAAQSNLEVFDAVCRRLAVTATQVASETGISATTARRVLKEMEARGMLREVSGRTRGQVFLYQPFVDLLDDGL
ncbi:MAG: Fic family protein [Nannocystis sp.]|nr:Fic family protein [Nannocystis sp.]